MKEIAMARPLTMPILMMLLLAPGCGSLETNSQQGVGEAAPNFTHTDLDGVTHDLNAYKGQVVVLDFWATWCAPCVQMSPIIQNLHDQYKDRGVVVLSLQIGDPNGDAVGYISEHGYTFPVLPDADAAGQTYGITALPTFVIIDQQGVVAHRIEGQTGERGLQAKIDRLLGG